VKPQELVDRRWAAGRILTLDGFPHRGQPICLTEFGGIARLEGDAEFSGEWGYTIAKDTADFEQRITSLIEVVRTTAMFSGFCYTQFADTFQESNGLLTADRNMKIPVDKLSAAVRGNAPLLPAL